MGGTQSTEHRTEIENEIKTQISVKITNITENINKLLSNQTSSVVNELKTEIQSTIESKSNTENNMEIADLNVDGAGSEFNIKQIADVKSETQALIKICSDTSSMASLASKMTDSIKNKTANDSSTSNDLQTLSALSSTKSDAGGPEAMVKSIGDSVMGTVQGIIAGMSPGSSISTSDTTLVKNKISTSIDTEITNRTSNTNIVENEIQDSIKNSLSNLTKTGCLSDFNQNNKLKFGKVNVKNGGKANIEQVLTVQNMTKCIVDLKMGSSIVNDIMKGTAFSSESDTSNTNKVENKVKTTADTTAVDTKESSIMKTILIIGVVAIIIGGIVSIAGIIFYNRKSFGIGVKDTDKLSSDEIISAVQSGGGKSPTIYLLLSLLLFLVFLYKTSKKVFYIISVILCLYLLCCLKK